MAKFRNRNIATVDECRFILGVLLREISECDHCRQKHIDALRTAIVSERLAQTAAEIIEQEVMEGELLK
jgi:hypothetical protein